MTVSDSEIDFLLGVANSVREVVNLDEAVQLLVFVEKACLENGYIKGQVHVYLQMSLIYRLKYQTSNLDQDKVLVKENVKKAETLLETNQDLGLDYKILVMENSAAVAALDKDWKRAEELWSEIVALRKKEDAYQGRAMENLAEAMYKIGEKSEAKKIAESAVQILEQNDERELGDGYEYRWYVWYTGALMKLFYILNMEKDPRSEEIKNKLESILEFPKLTHRRRQWEDLKRELMTDQTLS